MSPRDQRGAATLLVLSMVAVLLSLAVALSGVAALVIAHRRAQAAADLAALAGASALARGRDACPAAAAVATANGARLVTCAVLDRDVRLQVRVEGPVLLGRRRALDAQARAGPG